MAAQDCIEAARKALSFFDESEIAQYAKDVFARAKTYTDLTGRAAINRAQDEIDNERLKSYFDDAVVKANNTVKFERLANLIREGKANLKEIMIRRYKNLSNNIESSYRAARFKLYNSFFQRLTPEERNFMLDSKNDIDIFRAMDGKDASPMAKSIAAKHEEYIKTRNAELVSSNAMPLEYINKDRNLRAVHDQSKMLSGGSSLIDQAKRITKRTPKITVKQAKTAWKDFIKPLLDMDETFKDTAAVKLDPESPTNKLNNAEVDRILDKIFDDIVTEKGDIQTRSTVANNREAMARKKRMFFQWKDNESFMKYNQKYGQQTYFSALMSDIESSARKVGMANLMGDSPVNAFTDLRDVQQSVDPKSNSFIKKAEAYYNQMSKGNSYAVSPSGAAIGSTLRNVTAMARLGKLAIQGMTDSASGIAFGKRWGFDYFDAYKQHLSGLFNLLKTDERVKIAKMFKMNCDAHLGYVGRYVDAMNVNSVMSKATMAFFHRMGVEALDNGNKISCMTMVAHGLGEMSSKVWGDLPQETRVQLSKYDINEPEWEVLRKQTQDGLFTTDNADNLPDEDVKKLQIGNNQNVPLSQLRNDLNMRIFSMIDVASENAYLSPNAFTKYHTTFGTQAGTIAGELVRFMMQFKGYSISFADRVLYQGFKDAIGAKAKIGFAMSLIGATLPISVLSTWLYYFASGQSLPSWDRMNTEEKVFNAVNILSPTTSFINSILSPDNFKNPSNLLIDALNGASLRTLSDSLAGAINLLEDDPKKAMKSWKKASKGILPLASIPFVSPFLDKMYGDKAYLQPGQTQIYGA